MADDKLAEIEELEQKLDTLIRGKSMGQVNVDELPQEMRGLGERINRLAADLEEQRRFTQTLAQGDLNMDPPGRKNYLAAPVKEIHSQLSSFLWSIKQLVQGNMVSKLYYSGELYELYNQLVEKVSVSFSQVGAHQSEEWGGAVNSWRYHQILAALNHLHIMIIEVNQSGKVIFANPPVRELLDDMSRLPYGTPESQNSALIRYLCSFENASPEPPPGKVTHEDYPVFHELHYNSGIWYKITTDAIRLTDGSYGFLHMIDDISEWKRYEQSLTISATIDSLTGAYNRETGMFLLEELVHQERQSGTHCIAFIDLDNLKSINDHFGHSQGDHAIKTLVRMLLDTVRETDSVIRYGGDEFIVIFRNCDESAAVMVMDRVSQQAALYNRTSGRGYSIALSYGVAQLTPDTAVAADLISVADERMYQNKMRKKASLTLLG